VAPPVGDQVGDADQRQVVLGGEGLEVGHAHHGAVVVDHLAEHAGRPQPGEHRQVDGGLGVPGAAQHAAGLGPQRHHVARAGQVGRAGGRVGEQPDGVRPVGRRDPGADALAGVHGHRVRRAPAVLVDVELRREVEPVGLLLGQRRADVAGGPAAHERHQFGRGVLRGEDQVALVLAVLVVHDDHRLPRGDVLDRPLDVMHCGLRASSRRTWR
jgi:hypothetical protein